MSRLSRFSAAILAAALLFAPALAEARAGGGFSFGSRGSRTYSAPPTTNTAPFSAAPIERSYTAPSAPPSGYANPGYAAPAYGGGYAGGYARRSPFMSGLMGGLIGAGIGGLLFGHGLFGGIDGAGGFLGFLLQIFLLVLLGRWLLRSVLGRQPAFAGMGNFFARTAAGPGPRPVGAGRPAAPTVALTRDDYAAFERLLYDVQAAWSAQDLNGLRALATPEMVSLFGEQLAELSSRGARNTVTQVQLEHGDLSEAWAEGNRQYATVAMRFRMVDVTRDTRGHVVDGSPEERVTATELWTFLRTLGGRWMLSAIQQGR